MSNYAITWAYKLTGIKPGPKFVLVTIANYANDDGECFPSIDTIARDCGMHRSTVINAIKHLEDAGLISVSHRGGEGDGRKSNVYRIEYQNDGKVGNHDQLSRELLLAKSEITTKGKVGNHDQLSRNFDGAKSEITTLTTIEPINTKRKKEKRKKETWRDLNYDSWPCLPPEEQLTEIMRIRKAKGGVNTQRAIDMIGRQLHQALANGFTAQQCFDTWEARQWRGFDSTWMEKQNGTKKTQPGGDYVSRAKRVADKLDEIARRDIEARGGIAETLG